MSRIVTIFKKNSMFSAGFLLASLFTTPGLAAPAAQAQGAALGKVSWVAVTSKSRKTILAQVRRITAKSQMPIIFLGRCSTWRDCRNEAKKARASMLLTARVEALGSTYLFRLQGHCLDRKSKVIEKRAACEVCTIREAGRKLAKALVALASTTRGKACGIRPTPRPVRKEPARAQSKEPISRPGPDRASTPSPTAGPVPSTGPQSPLPGPRRGVGSRSPRRAALLKLGGWILGGVALGAVATGSVLLAMDGRGTCSGAAECPKVYDFKAAGIATLALGSAGLAAAVTMVVLGYHWSGQPERLADAGPPRRWLLTAAPLPGGFTLGAAGRF